MLFRSEEIAVFMCVDHDTATLGLQHSEGQTLLLPGIRLHGSPLGKGPIGPDFFNVRVTDLPPDTPDKSIKKKVVTTSTSFSHQITEYFDLRHTDIPALVLLCKDCAAPLVIRTCDEANIQSLLALLKDIHSIELPHKNEPLLKKKNAKARMRDAELHLSRAETELNLAIDSLKRSAVTRDIPGQVLDEILTRNTADKVKYICGVHGKDAMPAIAQPHYKVFLSAISDPEFSEACKLLEQSHYKLCSLESDYKRAAKLVSLYENKVKEIEEKLITMNAVHLDIEKLCKKYERIFQFRAAFDKILGFVNAVIGTGKRAKELADTREIGRAHV